MIQKRVQPAAILVLLLALTSISAFAASFSTNASADAFVTTGPTGNLVDKNYGGAGSLTLAPATQEMGEAQSVLRFDLGGAVNAFNTQFGAGQWSVQSVTLQLTAAPANNPVFNSPLPGTFGISWMQNDSWQEGTGTPASPGTSGITFNTLPSFIGPNDQSLGSFLLTGATSGTSSYSLGLAPGFVNDVTSGNPVSLRLFAADDTASGVFNSRNFSTVANRPALIVVVVPEPGTIAVGALGLIVMAVWKLREKEGLRSLWRRV